MVWRNRALRGALMTAVSTPVLLGLSTTAWAQGADLGAVTVAAAPKPVAQKKVRAPVRAAARPAARTRRVAAPRATPAPVVAGLPISSDRAIGSAAPAGSAPALAPSQGSLNAFQPGSVVSDKILHDVVAPGSDYNETVKYTPGFYSSNGNSVGDSKSGWRGFKDGQFNITYDGIPFGDANDPSHHSAAYFPSAFIGSILIDRGPGAASQVGYATFGGTMAMRSYELSDKFGGNVQSSFGTFNTFTTSATVQSGLIKDTGVRAMLQFSHLNSTGQIQYGKVKTDQVLAKVDKDFGGVKLTAFANYGVEAYNNVNSITWQQLQQYGKNYGQVNGNRNTQQYVGYNNSVKQTDMEYLKLEASPWDWHIDNKLYTYSYYYPTYQNNAADQTVETGSGAIQSVTVPVPPPIGGKSAKIAFNVAATDVTGFIKYNNYRAYGDIFNVSRDVNAGVASGTFRTGFWVERVDNERLQEYVDYTTGQLYPSLFTSAAQASAFPQAAYKLNLNSHIVNFQPYAEYEWKPTEKLSITPGYKYESFTRIHDAAINQTTLQPLYYTANYTASLPFLAVRYKVNDEMTVYAQASKGFLAPTVSAFYVFNPANGGIAPQTTTNLQAGAVYKSNAFTASFDIYQITANNFPVTSTVVGGPNNGDTLYQNAGTARYRGAELEGTYAFGNGLAAYASGALIEAKFIKGPNTGLIVGGAPRYTLAGGLIYDDGMFFGSLLNKVTGDSYGAGGQIVSTAAANGTLNKIAAFSTTDFVAGIRSSYFKQMGLGEKAEFKIGVSNIFDHRSLTDVGGTPGGLTPVTAGLTYAFQPGRTIYAQLKVDF